MKKLLLLLCAILLIFGLVGSAGATVLTFDDVMDPMPATNARLPNGYGGLNWNNFWVINSKWDQSGGIGYTTGVKSPDYVAANYKGEVSSAGGGVFNFLGAYLTSAHDAPNSAVITGYLGPDLVYQTDPLILTVVATEHDFGTAFYGIDRLTFSSTSQFVMDNVTYNPVPEPATMLLLGFGLIGMTVIGRKRFFRKA